MGIIKRLPDSVVNRIAAGEVVVRPAHAVKELIENSLDAGSTEIIVSLKQGGLKLLQVQDNGKGIMKEDLDIVCERFTTSKLENFEDLMSMSTYGFRGEALASLSLVSKLSITSKPLRQACAYQGKYVDCKPLSIRPSAGLDGTCITAEDLFYNCPSRLQSYKNYSDEASKVADVVTRYAVHRPDISFALRRGGSGTDFRTKGDGNRIATITNLLGVECAEGLMEISHVSSALHYKLSGCLSKPLSAVTAKAVASKKNRQKSFFLFINGRAVQSAAIKFAVDTLFSDRDLVCSFVLLSLEMEPSRVDVNVHPTKENVLFLDEESTVNDIREVIIEMISNVSDSQMTPKSISTPQASNNLTSTQITRMPGFTQSDCPNSSLQSINEDNNSNAAKAEKKRADHQLVRTDHRLTRIDAFVSSQPAKGESNVEMVPISSQCSDIDYKEEDDGSCKREFNLESLENLRKSVCRSSSQSLRELLKAHTFVGCVSPEAILVQHSTALYWLNLRTISTELFYQAFLFSFGNLGSYRLEESIPIINLYFMNEHEHSENAQENGQVVAEIISAHSEMLSDFWSFKVEPVEDEYGEKVDHLTEIPSLFSGFIPQLEGLPQLIYDLTRVDWNEEETCFHEVSRALANFFVIKEEFCEGEKLSGVCPLESEWKIVIEHILMPKLRSKLIPLESFKTAATMKMLTNTSQLYRIFERC